MSAEPLFAAVEAIASANMKAESRTAGEWRLLLPTDLRLGLLLFRRMPNLGNSHSTLPAAYVAGGTLLKIEGDAIVLRSIHGAMQTISLPHACKTFWTRVESGKQTTRKITLGDV